jgi:two-component sensor histidine kinase
MSFRSSSSWPSRWEWGIIVAFWATVAFLSAGQELFDDGVRNFHWGAVGREVVEYGLWALLTPVLFRFVEAFPVERSTATRAIPLYVGVAFATSIGIDITEDVVAAGIGSPYPPVGLLQQIQEFWFMDELVTYFIVLVVGFARTYYLQKQERQEEAERLEERAESLEAQLTEARLEALRMQLNPHFLFNTLHAVSTLVDRDPEGVRRMIARLSELLRHVLDEDAPQEVPLSQELDFLDDYLEIQSIRFQGDLDTEIDVPTELHDAQVPNLILQPLVENAIKHGASQVRGIGRIEVRGRRTQDRLTLTVEDNGPGMPDAQEDGFGLRNVRARLQELYGENQSLRLESDAEEGTRATLELPYHTSTSLYTAESRSTLATTAAPSADE